MENLSLCPGWRELVLSFSFPARRGRECIRHSKVGGDAQRECCDCCYLGIEARRTGQSCDVITLTYPCDEAFRRCCKAITDGGEFSRQFPPRHSPYRHLNYVSPAQLYLAVLFLLLLLSFRSPLPFFLFPFSLKDPAPFSSAHHSHLLCSPPSIPRDHPSFFIVFVFHYPPIFLFFLFGSSTPSSSPSLRPMIVNHHQ